MNIAMFTDTYLPSIDGVVVSLLTSKRELEKLGHNVYIFAPGAKDAPEEDRTFYFKAVEFTKYPGYRVPIMPAKGKNRFLFDNDIDVLHIHGVTFMALKAMYAARQLNMPILLTYHTMVTEAMEYYPVALDENLLKKLSDIYLKQLLKRVDGVIAPTNAIMNELKEYCPSMRYTDVIPTGVDLDVFTPDIDGSALREKIGLNDKKVILHVGRLGWEKNVKLLLEAMPIVVKEDPEAVLLVVGDGPAKKSYMEQAERTGLLNKNIIFTGFVPKEDLLCYYAMADSFVIASKFETQGIVVMEALATGLPVAGINYRAIPEIIKDGVNGYLFEEDPRDCARAVLSVLKNGPSMKVEARKCAEAYNMKECALKLVNAYEQVRAIKEERVLESKK